MEIEKRQFEIPAVMKYVFIDGDSFESGTASIFP
jgi:hypothetical protein